MKYSELLKQNDVLGESLKVEVDSFDIVIFSNIMVHQAKEVCEYSLRSVDVPAKVSIGGYDNIVQDSFKKASNNVVIIFWELCNLFHGLHYKIDLLSELDFDSLIEKTKKEIDIVFSNLKNSSFVVMNKFSSVFFSGCGLQGERMRLLRDTLNSYISSKESNNLKLIDLDSIITRCTIDNAVDFRNYKTTKTLYSVSFFKEYFTYISPVFLALTGKVKKAIIFDCDNTLWKGVLGEDGFEGIEIFEEVQSLALALSKRGVLLCLCSKNNPADVDEVLRNHKDMILRDENIIIKKVNWEDKVTNIKAISHELNIGLESLVFVDDSDFEINFVRQELPMVKVFHVPKREYEYSSMFRELTDLFYTPSLTEEDYKKVSIYKDQFKRKKMEGESNSIEEYLESLELKIVSSMDDARNVPRLSQLTQKTNQFNLTTRRYTESDIELFIRSEKAMVLSFQVSDKFGDNGIVALVILKFINDSAVIDTFLMSCRVIGRNVEFKIMDVVVECLKEKGVKIVFSEFVETAKNHQVKYLYERFGFDCVGFSKYKIDTLKYVKSKTDYIELESVN
jgi:FkbH-like protein